MGSHVQTAEFTLHSDFYTSKTHFNILTSTAVAIQQADKQTPISMQRSRYCCFIIMETLFPIWCVPRCKQDSLKQRVSCWLELSAVPFMRERVQLQFNYLKVSLCRED
jgi:hypothetical protein